MGNSQSYLSEEEIQNYLVGPNVVLMEWSDFWPQDTTFLTRKEVLRVVERFIQLAPDIKRSNQIVIKSNRN